MGASICISQCVLDAAIELGQVGRSEMRLQIIPLLRLRTSDRDGRAPLIVDQKIGLDTGEVSWLQFHYFLVNLPLVRRAS